jgi:hypothetical protein
MHLTKCIAFSSDHLPFLVDTMSSITLSRQYSWPLLRTRPYSRLASGDPAIPEETSVDKRVKDISRRILAAFIIRLHSGENTTAEPTTENTTAEPTTENTTAEPTTENTTAEPTTENTTAEPTTENTTAEPTTENTTAEPTKGTAENQQ